MPASVTYVLEEHSSFAEGAFKPELIYLALGILEGRAVMGIEEGWYGLRERLRIGV